jgi:hypothetical protein
MAEWAQSSQEIVSDGRRGAIIVWDDGRIPANGKDIYAQRIYQHECDVSQDSLDFGTVILGFHRDETFTVTNVGGIPFTGSITESCPDFAVVSTVPPDDPFSLDPGEDLLVTIRFEPTVTGPQYCTIDTGDSTCWDMECTGVGFDCPAGTLYVDHTATGSGSGTSWEDAKTDLQDALALADYCGTIEDIWVAAGTYTPTDDTDRSVSFELQNGLDIYGGFAGHETTLGERDIETNPTILSGELGGYRSYHVVRAGSGINYSAVLDGFTIRDGRADGAATVDQYGGGMYCDGYPTVRNCTFFNNRAGNGGGLYSNDAAVRLYYCTFKQNTATSNGGGMYNEGLIADLQNAVFSDNNAYSSGGGLYLNALTAPAGSIRGATFYHNNGGGLFNNSGDVEIVNAVFYENYGTDAGAGMRNVNGGAPAIINATFVGNTATSSGGGLQNGKGASPTIINSIFWDNEAPDDPQIGNYMIFYGPYISYSIIENCGGSGVGWDPDLGEDDGNNLDEDPRLRMDYSPDPSLMLWSSSPAINSGSNTAVPGGVVIDINGDPRFHNTVVDRGAYEFQGDITTDVDEDMPKVPDAFALYQNSPNPFNPVTTIRFDLPRAADIKLAVYNVKGELVATLIDGRIEAGSREVSWDGRDGTGRTASSGVYFYRLTAGDFVETKKMILLR